MSIYQKLKAIIENPKPLCNDCKAEAIMIYVCGVPHVYAACVECCPRNNRCSCGIKDLGAIVQEMDIKGNLIIDIKQWLLDRMQDPNKDRCVFINYGQRCSQWATKGRSYCSHHRFYDMLPQYCTISKSDGMKCKQSILTGTTGCKDHVDVSFKLCDKCSRLKDHGGDCFIEKQDS